MYDLQSRWKQENGVLRYYGLRSSPNLFKNTVKLNTSQQAVVRRLPCDLTEADVRTLGALVGTQIVRAEEKRRVPTSLSEARFCKCCAANDFMIPGLEFDAAGVCPLCQTKAQTAHLRSLVPVMNEFVRSQKSRFDVALFYTGGKDSTYLLYYLAKVLHLKVLALTWEIPYMSDSARASIEAAKQVFHSVEFLTRKVANDDLRTIYRHLYAHSENACACPSLAYILFYPELVANKVPYFVAGNEPAQILGLYYNHMAPKFAYTFWKRKLLVGLLNFGRMLTLHPPLRKGQFHTLVTMRQLAYGDNPLKALFGYKNTLVSNVVEAIHQVPAMVKPLKSAIRRSSWSGNIPAFVQVDMNEICGGVYDWGHIRDVIERECDWVSPAEDAKGLHTSCKIEKCKEFSQFKRFYNMESTMIPFSALEIALASRDGHISRADAIAEMQTALGFSLDEVPECELMREYFSL